MMRSYANAAAFRQAIETRLRSVAQERRVQIQGLRLKLAIERLIARLFHEPSPPWRLKGGYAMELRFRPKARTTRDIDLTLSDVVEPSAVPQRLTEVHGALMNAASHDLGDFFEFTIPPARSELTAAPGGGGVFGVTAKVAGREFARFHIDIGFGDPILGAPDQLAGDDLLAFAEIPPPIALAIPKAQQFAEKIHAYTFPWNDRENTRSRDLVDMLLLIERGDLDPDAIRRALVATFTHRRRHPMPPSLASPPRAWAAEFPSMAVEAGISTTDIDEAFTALDAFWSQLQPIERLDN
jgi:hypothetical protein